MGEFLEGGAAADREPLPFSHSVSFAERNPLEIGNDNWATAERAARDIIRKVQPTSESEERRKQVVDYIQRLFRSCLGAEVFPYGSVPLKTFLPDGDIDLTTFGCANVEDALADDMKSVLEEEERNASSMFTVKDVQLIRAEVKLVKCIVEDIVVDVSFNQIGGLSTLCFLEQVDRLIEKDHLFKRSIILIKAWCYYESRVLGAHHGLISTYALETMVLYIFHHFHSTLDGPLAVLYKFLCYFSNFDWETYCISLHGLVRRTSLPAIDVEMPEDSSTELLLSSDFLNSCIGMFSVPSRDGNKKSHGFQQKHLNIFDPLKEVNNLGRSVSKGNFYRIRSAFSYGARKLASILSQPLDCLANELHKFFPNTMARHGGRQELDQNSDSDKLEGCSNRMDSESNDPSTTRDEDSWDLSGDYESYMRCLHYGRWSYENGLGSVRVLPLPHLPRPHFKPNGFSYPHHNKRHPGPPVFGLHPMLFPKPRGTGMYITNQPPQSYRPHSTHMMGNFQTHNNGGNAVYPEPSMHSPRANGVLNEREGAASLDLAEQAPAGTTSVSEKRWQQKQPTSQSPKSMQRSQSSLSGEEDRILLESSYHLKDEDDFPPLPV